MDVLLRTDVPDLPELLNHGSKVREKVADALAVVTHSQRKQQQCEEKQAQQMELESGVSSTWMADDEWMFAIDDELFKGGRSKARKANGKTGSCQHDCWCRGGGAIVTWWGEWTCLTSFRDCC